MALLSLLVSGVENVSYETSTIDSSPELNTTKSAGNVSCDHYDDIIDTWFNFDSHQLIRVFITWSLFLLSATGNVFVLMTLRATKKHHHFLMFHLALADLVYACFVLPTDAIWNTTMQWYSGHALCKFAQMLKQFGMYSSAFMVVVIGVDRVMAIANPTCHKAKHGIILVTLAWITSALCTIPAGVLFSIREVDTCEGIVITQCVDDMHVEPRLLQSYYFFTMFVSFLLPFFSTIISYSLIVCEISKMKERDRQIMGRRNSVNSESIQKAINRTILMRTLITLTFLLCWGPYYAKGIADWFIRDSSKPEDPGTVYQVSYLLLYFNCFLHPIVFGVFLKEIRQTFISSLRFCFKRRKTPKKNIAVSRCNYSAGAQKTTGLWNPMPEYTSNNNIVKESCASDH